MLILRYTPYGVDPSVLTPILRIRHEFASDLGGVDPWCIFRNTQRALGRLVRRSGEAEQGTGPDVISLAEFQLQPEVGEGAAVRLGKAVQVLKEEEDANSLPPQSRRRLAAVQAQLVDLLEYLEEELSAKQKPFSLSSVRKRRKADAG